MRTIPEPLRRVLDLARWAPSGDNTQPWRFEILGDAHVCVHGLDTRDHVVYDLDGHASQLAVGALLETLVVAASVEGHRVELTRRPDTPDDHLLIDAHFTPDPAVVPDPLASVVREQVVQRRAMSTRALTPGQKQRLEHALPTGYRVRWFERFAERAQLARLMFDNAKVRLTIPEAHAVHRDIIEWGARYSPDRIPEEAVGVDRLTARLMRWALASWARVEFLNKWLLGDLAPRVQLDLVPGFACAAHFTLHAPAPLATVDDYLAAGRALQRFWLTAAQAGLFVQPEMTPVIFARYHRERRAFTARADAQARVARLSARLAVLAADADVAALYFIGRIGSGPKPISRSLRRPLDELLVG